MTVSRVDQLYRKLLLTKFFTKGWGKPDNLKRIFAFRKILSNREKCQHLVSSDYPIHIDKEYRDGGIRVLEGHFTSPFVHHLPGIMPPEVETASFQMVLPVKWQDAHLKPVCIHLAGTGDHFFWRRRLLTAKPLLKESGIASIILENPYYGSRKPKQQLRSSLHNVSDLFVMGGALILESMALLHWCQREGWGPLGISGISMGGHMASLAATNWNEPISLIPCLSWSTASCVFTQGVMSKAIPWETLQDQFFSNSIYQDEIKHLIVSPEFMRKNAYDQGMQFVKDYAATVDNEQALPSATPYCKYEPSLSAFEHHTIAMRNKAAAIKHVSEQTPSKSILDDPSYSTKNKVSSDIGNVISISNKSSKSNTKLDLDISVRQSSSFSGTSLTSESSGLNQLLPASPSANVSDLTSPNPSQNQPAPQIKSKKRRFTTDPSMPISLSYAKTKELQQQAKKDKTISKELHLQHALSKSGLSSAKESDSKQVRETRLPSIREEAFDFMRGVMDECTHLGNFSIPIDPELIIIVAANQDAYIPRDGVLPLDQLWPGSEVRYVDQGHVGAVILHQKIFRKAVTDAFDRQIIKYHKDSNKDDFKPR